jgi:hypothetical protein
MDALRRVAKGLKSQFTQRGMVDATEGSAGGLSVFRDTSPGVVEALVRSGVEASYSAESVLFLAGGRLCGWLIVLDGRVRVVRGSGDRQHSVGFDPDERLIGPVQQLQAHQRWHRDAP